jgi:uncharacterized protein (TIGR00255 family)
MVKSMTGFGSAQTNIGDYEINVEVKSLNSKFADVSIRLPSQLSIFELEIKKLITEKLQRGKITFVIDPVYKGVASANLYDVDAIQRHYQQLVSLANSLGAETADVFKLALQSPGVMVTDKEDWPEDSWNEVAACILSALAACNEFRQQEGAELEDKIDGYLQGIESALVQVDQYEGARLVKVEERLKANLSELESKLSIDVDKNRFEQELIYYIEKYDISEEKVRLSQHLQYFREAMASKEPNGKKLGFISQEIGREINTLGSKANNADLQRLVVQMKEELEKIKEQMLNIL